MAEFRTKPEIGEGQIVALGTEGVWEARGHGGEMFGKQALCDIVRKKYAQCAHAIVEETAVTLKKFWL